MWTSETVLVFLYQGSAGSFPRRQRVSISVCLSHVTRADLHGRKTTTTDISFKMSAHKIQSGVTDHSLTTHTHSSGVNHLPRIFFIFVLPTGKSHHSQKKLWITGSVDCHKPTKYKHNKDMQSAVNEHRSSALCTMFFIATNAFGIIHKLNICASKRHCIRNLLLLNKQHFTFFALSGTESLFSYYHYYYLVMILIKGIIWSWSAD